MRYLIAAVLAACALAAPVAAQDSGRSANGDVAPKASVTKDSTGRILGVLDADTGNPVVGAEVVDRITGVTAAFTNEYGIVRLGSFRTQHDTSVVTVRKIGYQDSTFLAIQSDTAPITLMLAASVPVLPAVIAKAMSNNSFINARAFNERLSDKNFRGKYITPEEMRKFDGRKMMDVLTMQGMFRTTEKCTGPSLVEIDGNSVGKEVVDYADRFAAAVYYFGEETPMEFWFGRGSEPPPCGVLLLYSRGAN